MKTFLLKTCLILSIFFIGVLIGSFHNRGWQGPYSYGQAAAGQEELPVFSLFSKDEAEIDLHMKQERLQEEESVNVFSKVGESLADAVTFAAASLFNS